MHPLLWIVLLGIMIFVFGKKRRAGSENSFDAAVKNVEHWLAVYYDAAKNPDAEAELLNDFWNRVLDAYAVVDVEFERAMQRLRANPGDDEVTAKETEAERDRLRSIRFKLDEHRFCRMS